MSDGASGYRHSQLYQGSTSPDGGQISNIKQHSQQSPVLGKRKSSRTGQACDRCKLRKIKCNATTSACTPCLLAKVPCTNTDLNSRRAVPRGYIENLESQIDSMRSRIRELETIVSEIAPDINLSQLPNPENLTALKQQRQDLQSGQPQHPQHTVLPSIESLTSLALSPADRKYDDNRLPVYVGERLVAPDQKLGSWDEATLSIFGIRINLRDLAPGSLGDANLFEIFSCPKPTKMELPSYEEAKLYVESYIAVVHPVIPAVSTSWIFETLNKLYTDETYVATPQTCVIMNMIFALITSSIDLYQRKMNKNRENYTPVSDTFYRRIFPYFHDLFHRPDLSTVQAFVLLLVFLRPSPRPQASWALGRIAMTLAIQMGLHRENVQSVGSKPVVSIREAQMRKRVFWCLLSLESAVSNRLGRPLALNNRNFDVELPMAVDDDFLDDPSGDYSDRPCSFLPALALFGLTRISSGVYSTFYAVKKPTADEYERLVIQFEQELEQWKITLPESLTWKPSDPTGDLRDKRYAGIMWLTVNELHLFIRHPSGSTTSNQKFNDKSRNMSVRIARELLHTMHNLMKINHVESTWYNVSVLLTSLFTTLYGAWSLKDISTVEINQVKEDVDIALSVIDEIAISLGTDMSNNKMRDIVSALSDETVSKLEERNSMKSQGDDHQQQQQQNHHLHLLHQAANIDGNVQQVLRNSQSQSAQGMAFQMNSTGQEGGQQVPLQEQMSNSPYPPPASSSTQPVGYDQIPRHGTPQYAWQNNLPNNGSSPTGPQQPTGIMPINSVGRPSPHGEPNRTPSRQQHSQQPIMLQQAPANIGTNEIISSNDQTSASNATISSDSSLNASTSHNPAAAAVADSGMPWLENPLSWQDYVFNEMQTLEKVSMHVKR
ncbi:fungal-specific transcription factor domain-containing protein, partial [Dipodascopsis uninucleata]